MFTVPSHRPTAKTSCDCATSGRHSADATPSQIDRLLALGAKNYLNKSFDIEPFLAVVDETLLENAAAPIS
jgi:hypothetical protein